MNTNSKDTEDLFSRSVEKTEAEEEGVIDLVELASTKGPSENEDGLLDFDGQELDDTGLDESEDIIDLADRVGVNSNDDQCDSYFNSDFDLDDEDDDDFFEDASSEIPEVTEIPESEQDDLSGRPSAPVSTAGAAQVQYCDDEEAKFTNDELAAIINDRLSDEKFEQIIREVITKVVKEKAGRILVEIAERAIAEEIEKIKRIL